MKDHRLKSLPTVLGRLMVGLEAILRGTTSCGGRLVRTIDECRREAFEIKPAWASRE